MPKEISDILKPGRIERTVKIENKEPQKILYYKYYFGDIFWKTKLRRLAIFQYFVTIIIFFWFIPFSFVSAPYVFSNLVEGAQRQVSEQEIQLEQKLKELEKQIEEYEKGIQNTRREKQSLQRDISLLENQIKKLELQIKATDLQIRRLTSKIRDTQSAIYESQLKIARHKESLAASIQELHENDQVSILEMILSGNSIADFFEKINSLYSLHVRAQAELDQVYALKKVLEDQNNALLETKEEQVALLLIQQSQKSEVDENKKLKTRLLALTQGKESLYQELKKKTERTAAEIRAQLFRLRGGGQLSFGEAYEFAKLASALTGVRPALIMAVLSQESALGKNIGQCRLKDTSSGITVGINTGREFPTGMHPTRDLPVFLSITEELKLSPLSMPVSCPILTDGAYGGAMGIAQFLPSTWMLYKNRIASIVGHTPSPWDPKDAFVAAALYLADVGATSQTYEAERQAAAKYYAGSRWRIFLRSYGDRVMSLAEDFQEQIDILERGEMK
jgi:peptidoglycan hydrolase CwlO-like protein